MVPPCSDRISRVPSYSSLVIDLSFRVRGYHPLWPDFPDSSTNSRRLTPTGLVPVRSPLLRESRLMSFPPVTEMFQFTGFALRPYVFRPQYLSTIRQIRPWANPGTNWKTVKVGFPIRRLPDQRVLAPPRYLSQLATSFIASLRQGIRQKPFYA